MISAGPMAIVAAAPLSSARRDRGRYSSLGGAACVRSRIGGPSERETGGRCEGEGATCQRPAVVMLRQAVSGW